MDILRLLQHAPDAVLDDIVAEGLPAFQRHVLAGLQTALEQPVPLDAAGFALTIHGCGVGVWERNDWRGCAVADLFDGTPHVCPDVFGGARIPPPSQNRRYGDSGAPGGVPWGGIDL